MIALPLIGLAGHGDHVIVGLFGIGFGLVWVTTQRVDTGAQSDKKSGFTYPFAGMMQFKIAPFLFDG